jgi:chemotaxis protein CheZ
MDIWGGAEAFKEFTAADAGERDVASRLVNGPRLDSDAGHVSQNEIDAIFAAADTIRN